MVKNISKDYCQSDVYFISPSSWRQKYSFGMDCEVYDPRK